MNESSPPTPWPDQWCEPPVGFPALVAGRVHVWLADIAQHNWASDMEILSVDEKRRAAKYHFERDRARFVATRGALRRLLGRYLDVSPAGIAIEETEHGKPYVRQSGCPALKFNLSHSHERALFAFTLGTEIGVDVEHWRENLNPSELADRFFTPSEADEVRRAADADVRRVFCACWSRKEACVKALGLGLQLAPETFRVGAHASAPVEQVLIKTPTAEEALLVYSVPAMDGYGAALATCGSAPLEPLFYCFPGR